MKLIGLLQGFDEFEVLTWTDQNLNQLNQWDWTVAYLVKCFALEARIAPAKVVLVKVFNALVRASQETYVDRDLRQSPAHPPNQHVETYRDQADCMPQWRSRARGKYQEFHFL